VISLKKVKLPLALLLALLLSSNALDGCADRPREKPLDPNSLNRLTRMQGQWDTQEHVYKVQSTRTGIPLRIRGVAMPPSMTLRTWATLTGTESHAIVLGDLPVLQNEVNPILKEVLGLGLVVTAVHNTFLWDDPRIFSIHFQGTGTASDLASAVGRLFQDTASVNPSVSGTSAESSFPSIPFPQGSLDLDLIRRVLWSGEESDGSYRISTGKGTKMKGIELTESMEVNTWLSFSGTSGNAFVNGDIAMLESELTPVLQDLIQANVKIVSLHTHLAQEKPRLYFVHIWGEGKLQDLVMGLKRALMEEKNFRGST
jgi:hypothetical protein